MKYQKYHPGIIIRGIAVSVFLLPGLLMAALIIKMLSFELVVQKFKL